MFDPYTRWTYGDGHSFRILAEYSLNELKVEVFDTVGKHAIAAEDLKNADGFDIGGDRWTKIWQRMESDARGPYTAVALKRIFQPGEEANRK